VQKTVHESRVEVATLRQLKAGSCGQERKKRKKKEKRKARGRKKGDVEGVQACASYRFARPALYVEGICIEWRSLRTTNVSTAAAVPQHTRLRCLRCIVDVVVTSHMGAMPSLNR
jgi:hypothetical protein